MSVFVGGAKGRSLPPNPDPDKNCLNSQPGQTLYYDPVPVSRSTFSQESEQPEVKQVITWPFLCTELQLTVFSKKRISCDHSWSFTNNNNIVLSLINKHAYSSSSTNSTLSVWSRLRFRRVSWLGRKYATNWSPLASTIPLQREREKYSSSKHSHRKCKQTEGHDENTTNIVKFSLLYTCLWFR